MFRLYGRKIEILRYKISYKETTPEGEQEDEFQYTVTEEEANVIAEQVKGTVSPLDLEDDEWMDGIIVKDVPDTYGEAQRIYAIGEQAYNQEINAPSESERLSALEEAIMRGLAL